MILTTRRWKESAILALSLMAGPLSAVAVTQVRDCAALVKILNNLAAFGGGLITAVAVLVFIIAAYYFLFAGGSEEGAKKGRQFLTYGVVGIIVAVIAFSLPVLVQSITGLDAASCSPTRV